MGWKVNVTRYHGKCLKIARGKVKDDEKYTCPICDWRVKIPRDAARPKLEDLQSWQDEIPHLPFQPDEELVLATIIDNAQEFRNHVSPFCNPVMTTAEEVETQRFYLRKIEGAEILLSYETNFFRQELHKYSPVASEPPPILEASKSTRKPRPTKLQKLMQQHGVDDPDQLPQNLRTKPHTFKRKSSEPTSRPPTLQPAPGRSESGTPTGHSFPPTAQMHHNGPVLSGVPSSHDHAHPAHLGGYPGAAEPHFTMSGPSPTSPAFAPHAFMHNGLASPGYGGPSRQPGVFNESAFSRHDAVLGAGSNSPMRDAYISGLGVARMFDDLAQDGPKGEKRASPGVQQEPEAAEWEDQDEGLNMFFDDDRDD